MTVGERIRAARRAKGMTQKELAEKMGTSYVVISQWENGKRNPKFSTLREIAKALEIPTTDLLGIVKDDGTIEFSMPDSVARALGIANNESGPFLASLSKEQWFLVFDAVFSNSKEAQDELRKLTLLTYYDELNQAGKEKAVSLLNELACNPDFCDVENFSGLEAHTAMISKKSLAEHEKAQTQKEGGPQ